MPLDPDDLHLFYKLYPSLLCFVNQRQGSSSTPFTTPEHFGKLPIEERLKLRDALVANMDLIDAFVSENPFKLSEDELEIVRSWNDLVAGEFYVYRCLTKYTVFLTTREPVVAYGVLSLIDPFEDLDRSPAPHLCKAVLLPFKGRIVYDGLLAGYNVHVRERDSPEAQGVLRRRQGTAGDRHDAPAPRRELTSQTEEQPHDQDSGSDRRARTKGGKPTTSEAARLAHDEIVGHDRRLLPGVPRRRVCDLVPEAGGHPGTQTTLPADPWQARVLGQRDRAGRRLGQLPQRPQPAAPHEDDRHRRADGRLGGDRIGQGDGDPQAAQDPPLRPRMDVAQPDGR